MFSDVPKNTIYKWKEGEEISVFLSPSGYTGNKAYSKEPGSNGLSISNDGYLLACEHGDRRISKMPLNTMGGKVTIADKWEGKRFNSPNDLIQAESGIIYFTDICRSAMYHNRLIQDKDTFRNILVERTQDPKKLDCFEFGRVN